VRSVSLPGFSRLLGEPDALRSGFARSLGLLMAVTIPVCALLAALGLPLVRFVYGARWAPAASALAFLALLGVFRVALELAYDFLVAVGESRVMFRLQVVWLLALAPTLWLGVRIDGIRGVGIGHVVVVAFVVTPAYLWVLRRHGVRAQDLVAHLVRPLAGGALAIGAALAVQALAPGDLAQIIIGGAVALAAYVVVVWPLRRPPQPQAARRPVAWRRWSA
jgi:O-antigen/teichoic acid export membrane protein